MNLAYDGFGGVQFFAPVVFDDDVAATYFLRVVGEEIDRTMLHVPLWVSDGDATDALGPPGRRKSDATPRFTWSPIGHELFGLAGDRTGCQLRMVTDWNIGT